MRAGRRALLIEILATPFSKAATVSAFVASPSAAAAGSAPAARLGSRPTTATWKSSSSSSSSGGDDACNKHVTMFPSNNKEHHGGGGGGEGGAPEPGGLRRRPSLSLGARNANNASRRGGHDFVSSLSDGVHGGRPPANNNAVVLEDLRGGAIKPKNRLVIDYVEDAYEILSSSLKVVLLPFFHLTRLGFGLSLLFYGMAFRTFAFHVIVFRIAGFKQVRNSLRKLVTNYCEARKSIREAAVAAETVRGRVIDGNELKAAREKMIEEKNKLLSDGHLSEEETKYFMNRYQAELSKIKDEQEQFKSARSSVFSLQSAVSPAVARSSIGGLYSGLVTCFTASTIPSAGRFTLGLHIGNLLKTHVLDLFGPILDPIGYRLDLDTYYDKEDIPYMGRANAMDGPRNMALNIFCYSVVFIMFRVHPSIALKVSMVYYGARVVTDYVILAAEPARRKLGRMTIEHTPWSAAIHVALALLGFYHHRNVLHTTGIMHTTEILRKLHPLAVGPGVVGLIEPCVRFFVSISKVLGHIDFFRLQFLEDPVEMVKDFFD